MSAENTPPRLWLPQYWPSWLAVGLLRALAPLPLEALLALGRWLGRFAFYLVPVRRAVTEKNLELCFPELDVRARRTLARRCHESLGMGMFETLFVYFCADDRMAGRFTIEGLEHLEAAQRDKRGVLLLSAHFHTLEIAGRVANMDLSLSAFYRNPNNPVFAWMIRRSRGEQLKRIFPIDDLMGAVRALREGDIIWYAPDQGKRFKDTVIAPFFGVPAISNAATRKIAQLGRALVIPWSTVRERRDGRWHYRVTVHPPLTELPEDPQAEAVAINRLIEGFVRAAPEQYLWQHKRFKARGEGHPDVYAGMR